MVFRQAIRSSLPTPRRSQPLNYAVMATTGEANDRIPSYCRQQPPLVDDLKTDTSTVQYDTIQECLPLLNKVNNASQNPLDFNEFGLPYLEKEKHVQFLQENLAEFPAFFVGIDASRPWMVYWALLGLYLLGEDVSLLRSRYDALPVRSQTSPLHRYS